MQTHLIKCAKQYPHIKLAKCKINTTHLVKPEELDTHHKECPDRKYLLHAVEAAAVYDNQDSAAPRQERLVLNSQMEESWDDEVGTHDFFNAREAAKKLPIMRSNIGMTKAQKKRFREEERERIEEIKMERANQY